MEFSTFIGRLHPLVLHLPIGIFVFVFMMESYARLKKSEDFRGAISLGLLSASLFASISCFTGWLLSSSGDYSGDLIWYHKWGAIVFTLLAWMLYFLQKRTVSKSYFYLLCLAIIGLTYVGHQGASLTHGPDFLWAEDKGVVHLLPSDELVVFKHLIQPILKKKCQSCHNEGKKKGKLDLSNFAGITLGGKHGSAIEPNTALKSLMIERIHLPLEVEEHMPPENKKQLTADEIKLLEWWIEEGALEHALLKDIPKNEDISTIISKYSLGSQAQSLPPVDRLDDEVLNKFAAIGLPFTRLSNESPFVALDLAHRKDLSKKDIKQILKVKNQLVDLDLAFTNVNDDLVKVLKPLKHVERLELQGTELSVEGLKGLGVWNNLKVLNVYSTKVDDAFLDLVDNFPALQRIYLWQTNMSPHAVDSLSTLKPRLDVENGVATDLFGDSKLLPPTISAESDLFTDSLIVHLDMDFQGVNIYYSLDGTDPDLNSFRYDKPLNLRHSSLLKAVCIKDGWEPSSIVERQFVFVEKAIEHISLLKPPSDKYKANGAKTLIDLVQGSSTFSDGQWLGFEGEGMEARLDLGSMQSVSSLSLGALEATGSYIFFPKGLTVLTSKDGVNFNQVAKANYQTTTIPNQEARNKYFQLSFNETEARYLKVLVDGQMTNPNWHPAPGAKSWLFVDEILVD